jgi:hypothetical protein
MTDQQGVIRRISWRDLFPWLILFRAFRIAISPSLLAVATVAVLISPLGWRLASRVFLSGEQRAALQDAAIIPRATNSQLAAYLPKAARDYLPDVPTALLEAYFDLAEPLKRFFQFRMTLQEAAYYAFGFLWTLVVWAFPGGVITRRAVVQLATESVPEISRTSMYAGRRYHWYFLAPLYPLLGIVLVAIPIALFGLLIPFAIGAGSVLAGVMWLFVALLSLGALWLVGGLIFGWPLMWPTISAERDGDPFEAFSRSYSYVYGKPLHYFFYVVVAAAFGALCWAVVAGAALIVQEFGFWALAWPQRIASAFGYGDGNNVEIIRSAALRFAEGGEMYRDEGSGVAIGTTLIGLVVALIQSVAAAFRYAYFFTAASAIYLLLRQDVDEKEMDEVYVEAEKPITDAHATTSESAPEPKPDHEPVSDD